MVITISIGGIDRIYTGDLDTLYTQDWNEMITDFLDTVAEPSDQLNSK